MALQTSGAISLNDIHIEAGGTSGSQAAINDADIRDMISKASGSQMSFNEWYGASASGFNYFDNYYTNFRMYGTNSSNNKVAKTENTHIAFYGNGRDTTSFLHNGTLLNGYYRSFYYRMLLNRSGTGWAYLSTSYNPRDMFKGDFFSRNYQSYQYFSASTTANFSQFYKTNYLGLSGTTVNGLSNAALVSAYGVDYYGKYLYQSTMINYSSGRYYTRDTSRSGSVSTGNTNNYFNSRCLDTHDGLTWRWVDSNSYIHTATTTGTAYQVHGKTFSHSQSSWQVRNNIFGGYSLFLHMGFPSWYSGNKGNIVLNTRTPNITVHNLSTAFDFSNSSISSYTSYSFPGKFLYHGSNQGCTLMRPVSEMADVYTTLTSGESGYFFSLNKDYRNPSIYSDNTTIWGAAFWYSTGGSIPESNMQDIGYHSPASLFCNDWGGTRSVTINSPSASQTTLASGDGEVLGFCFNSTGTQIWVLMTIGFHPFANNSITFSSSFFGFKVYSLSTPYQVEPDLSSSYVHSVSLATTSAQVQNYLGYPLVAGTTDTSYQGHIMCKSNGSKIFMVNSRGKSWTLTLNTANNLSAGFSSINERDLSAAIGIGNPISQMDIDPETMTKGFIAGVAKQGSGFKTSKLLELDFTSALDNSTLNFTGSFLNININDYYGINDSAGATPYNSFRAGVNVAQDGSSIWVVGKDALYKISLNTAFDFTGGFTKTTYALGSSQDWYRRAIQIGDAVLYRSDHTYYTRDPNQIFGSGFLKNGTKWYCFYRLHSYHIGVTVMALNTAYDLTSYNTSAVGPGGGNAGHFISLRGRGRNDSSFNADNGQGIQFFSYPSANNSIRFSQDLTRMYWLARYNDYIYRIITFDGGLGQHLGQMSMTPIDVSSINESSSDSRNNLDTFLLHPDSSGTEDRLITVSTQSRSTSNPEVTMRLSTAGDMTTLPSTTTSGPNWWTGFDAVGHNLMWDQVLSYDPTMAAATQFIPRGNNFLLLTCDEPRLIQINRKTGSSVTFFDPSQTSGSSYLNEADNPTTSVLSSAQNICYLKTWIGSGSYGWIPLGLTFNEYSENDITEIQGYALRHAYVTSYPIRYSLGTTLNNFSFTGQTISSTMGSSAMSTVDGFIIGVNGTWDPDGEKLTMLDYSSNCIKTSIM